MVARIMSCALIGLEGVLVTVEVDIAGGLPAFHVVGLGDAAVQESRERVRAAVRNSGYEFPARRVTASLAPSDLRKAGPAYDLSIALGLLAATNQLVALPHNAVFLGELGLDGTLRHIDGILPMVAVARDAGIGVAYVPHEDAREAALVEGITVIPVHHIAELVAHLSGRGLLSPIAPCGVECDPEPSFDVDLAHIQGQEHVKRALEIAAAGGHNLLMTGTPGSGKTMMARALVSILPPLSRDEALEVTRISSVAGLLPRHAPLIRVRPFCAPHHTTSLAGLVGGGAGRIRPGMLSLAHRGVLFLDELPEFGSRLEVLRQPLEDRVITLSRASGSVTFPASIMLIAAQNPCPCGWYGDTMRRCQCSAAAVQRYQARVSGPLLDRIDVHVTVPRVEHERLVLRRPAEASRVVRARVSEARERQRARWDDGAITCNADMGPAELRELAVPDDAAQRLLDAALRQLGLSARGYYRVLKLARTIADLAGVSQIDVTHVGEALQYRPAARQRDAV